MATKKIINPRKNNIKHGQKEQIKGLYRVKKEAASYVTRNFGDVIRKLSNQ